MCGISTFFFLTCCPVNPEAAAYLSQTTQNTHPQPPCVCHHRRPLPHPSSPSLLATGSINGSRFVLAPWGHSHRNGTCVCVCVPVCVCVWKECERSAMQELRVFEERGRKGRVPEMDKHKNTRGRNKPSAVEVILHVMGRVLKNSQRTGALHGGEGVEIKQIRGGGIHTFIVTTHLSCGLRMWFVPLLPPFAKALTRFILLCICCSEDLQNLYWMFGEKQLTSNLISCTSAWLM